MQAAFGAGISIAILILWMMLDPEMYTRSHHIRTSAISPMLEPLIMFSAMAILEETLYRGILQRFLQSFLPIWIAAAIQIGIFVLGHDVGKIDNIYSFYRAADLCAAGILFTVLANRSKYLILPILAHFSENFFTGLFNGVQDLGLGESYLPIMDFDLYLHEEVRIVIILCVSIVLLIWMKKKYPDANDLFAKGQSSPAKNSEEHAAVAAPQVASI